MKDPTSRDESDARERESGSQNDRWKSMPDGDAKLAAYLEQARASDLEAYAKRRAGRSAPAR
jgi:hypothetical protein